MHGIEIRGNYWNWNGGFEDELIFTVHESRVVPVGNGQVRITLECGDVKQLVANDIRNKRIAKLENASDSQLLYGEGE